MIKSEKTNLKTKNRVLFSSLSPYSPPKSQDIQTIQELLNSEADINFRNDTGESILDLIKRSGSDEIKKNFKIKIKNNDIDNNNDQPQNKSYIFLAIPITVALV